MGKYIVELVIFDEHGSTSEAVDLVNIESGEHIPASNFDFAPGETVEEGDFYLKKCSYVDDQGVGSCDIAFKTNNL